MRGKGQWNETCTGIQILYFNLKALDTLNLNLNVEVCKLFNQ